jgi:hypothetical protein
MPTLLMIALMLSSHTCSDPTDQWPTKAKDCNNPPPEHVWTLEQAVQFCAEQRRMNGHSACELPPGVVVREPK